MRKVLLIAVSLHAVTLVPAIAAPPPKGPKPKAKEFALKIPDKPNAEQIHRLLQQFDANGDGKVDAVEQQAIHSAFGKFRQNPEQIKRLLEMVDAQLGGKPNASSRPSKDQLDQLLKQFDHNGDGELGPQERAAAQRAKEILDRNQHGHVDKRELKSGSIAHPPSRK
jgi:Ca2+-binding EF-hand superfamily protein